MPPGRLSNATGFYTSGSQFVEGQRMVPRLEHFVNAADAVARWAAATTTERTGNSYAGQIFQRHGHAGHRHLVADYMRDELMVNPNPRTSWLDALVPEEQVEAHLEGNGARLSKTQRKRLRRRERKGEGEGGPRTVRDLSRLWQYLGGADPVVPVVPEE